MQSVAVISFSKDRSRILLIKRRDIPVWVLPGGGIEKGELPEKAALREFKEETGCEGVIIRKIAEYTPLNRLSKYTFFFECAPKRLFIENFTGPETLQARLFALDHLPKLPPPYTDWINDAIKSINAPLFKPITTVTYKKFFTLLCRHPILVSRFLLTKIGIHYNRG